MNLQRDKRDMIQKDIMAQIENGSRSMRLVGESKAMNPQNQNGAKSMRLAGKGEAMSPKFDKSW